MSTKQRSAKPVVIGILTDTPGYGDNVFFWNPDRTPNIGWLLQNSPPNSSGLSIHTLRDTTAVSLRICRI